jgi:bifunctional non-homologous end joining protein LigD
MDVVEVHTWNARDDDVERPDRIVLDLDPGPEVRWPIVVAAARRVRATFSALGLETFVKTTGGTGLHVVAPLAPTPWRECLEVARALAEALSRDDPATFTTRFSKRGRERAILLDYLRNNRTNTSVAAYSMRARPEATVSTPLAWDELDARTRPERYTVRSVPRRLARLSRDPWAASFGLAQRIPAGAVTALDALR